MSCFCVVLVSTSDCARNLMRAEIAFVAIDGDLLVAVDGVSSRPTSKPRLSERMSPFAR